MISTCQESASAYRRFIRKKEVGVGVLGLGRSGVFFHCRPLAGREDFRLAAVYDMRADVCAQVGQDYRARAHASAEALLQDPEVDLIVVALPTKDHAEWACRAAASGRHVLVEKPFATSSAEAREMLEVARRYGVFMGAFHNRRYDPDVRTLREILDTGVLGPLVKISIHLHSYTRRKDWQTLRSMGGGALANWGVHAFDWAFYLLGTNLQLENATLFRALNAGDAEDSFNVRLRSGKTLVDIEYLNCASLPLPRWHVVGLHGTAVSNQQAFLVRACDPARLLPVETDPAPASDGSYGISEDLGWTENRWPWGHWDGCPLFFNDLFRHLSGEGPPPVSSSEILAELELLEEIRSRAPIEPLLD